MAHNGYQSIPTHDAEDMFDNSPPPAYSRRGGDVETADDMYKRPVSESPIEVKMSFLRKVYGILSLQLTATAVMSVLAMFHKPYQNWMMTHSWSIYVALAVALIFMILANVFRSDWPVNILYLSVFTVAMGYITSFATAAANTSSVVLALFMTLTLFFGLTLFTIQSKIDFESWAPWLFGGLLLLVAGGFLSAFFPYSSVRELLFGIGGTIIFSGYIMLDTYRIMGEMYLGDEVAAALTLYLDVLNLFISILRILNSQNSRD